MEKEKRENQKKKVITVGYVLIAQVVALCLILCWNSINVFAKDIAMVALAIAIWIKFNNNYEADKEGKTFKLLSNKRKGKTRMKFIQGDPEHPRSDELKLLSLSNDDNDKNQSKNKSKKKWDS